MSDAGLDAERGSEGHGLTQRCPDCGTVLVGAWCHACGQAGHPHRSFGAIGHDLLHGVLHFEGKVWRTLPMLAWRPGELTRRFIAGERQWFISPFALFLFAVFLGYAVANLGGPVQIDAPSETVAGATGVSDGAAAAREIKARLERIDDAIAAARARGAPTTELENERAVLRRVGAMTGGAGNGAGNDSEVPVIATGFEWIDHALTKARANPSLVLYKLQTYAYKYAWAVIPLSMPFMWLLFPFSRRYNLYDHYVFVTYSLAFVLLLFVVVRLLVLAGIAGDGVVAIAMLYVPVHMYRQLRDAYRGGRAASVVRVVLLVAFAGAVSILFAAMLLTLGLSG